MPPVTQLTGTFLTPDGEVYAHRPVWFRPARAVITGQAEGVEVPEEIEVTTDAAGMVAVDLHPGNYRLVLRLADREVQEALAVPESDDPLDIGALVGGAAIPTGDFGLAAETAARTAAILAERSAVATLTNKTLTGGEMGGATVTFRGLGRTFADRGKDVVDVRDYSGSSPTGTSSNFAALQAALADLRTLSGEADDSGGRLVIPPSQAEGGCYVIDGSLDLTAFRGAGTSIDARGAKLLASGAGNVAIDMMHSNHLCWWGGLLTGDQADPPLIGLQVARQWTAGKGAYTSSQNHGLYDLTINGHWAQAGLNNFGSERLFCQRVMVTNETDDPAAYAWIFDGQSKVFPHVSAYRPVSDAGPPNGFSLNRLLQVGAFRPNGGPGLFVARVQNLWIDGLIGQTPGGPVIDLWFGDGAEEAGVQGLILTGRCEDSTAASLVRLIGDGAPIHRGLRLEQERLFADRLIDTNGKTGCRFYQSRLAFLNVFPNSDGQIFDTPSNVSFFDGEWNFGNKQASPTEPATVPISNLNVNRFRGLIRTSKLSEVTLPAGDYLAYDEEATRRGLLVGEEITLGDADMDFTFATPGDLSVSYASRTGTLIYLSDKKAHLQYQMTFTPTWTTAAGHASFRLLGRNFDFAGGEFTALQISNINLRFTWPVGCTQLMATPQKTSNYCRLAGIGSGISRAFVEATNMQSGTQHAIQFGGIVELR